MKMFDSLVMVSELIDFESRFLFSGVIPVFCISREIKSGLDVDFF